MVPGMSDFNDRMLARLEATWLDPDSDKPMRSEEKDEAMFEEADRRYAERCLDRE